VPKSNRSIIEKADIAVSDLVSDGGVLLAEQANRFVRKLIKEPTLLRDVRTVEMSAPTRKINKIQFNKRILRDADSGTALANTAVDAQTAFDPTDAGEGQARAKPLTEQVELNTVEVIAQVNIPYDVIEDNVERGNVGELRDVGGTAAGGGLIDTILQLMAERAALDLEELAILGDTAVGAADPYLDLQDGFLKIAETSGNVADQAGANVSKATFKDGMKTMPDQFLRNRAQLRQYVSVDQEIEWRDSLADKATALGDTATTGDQPRNAFGVPVVPVSQMPDDRGLFTNPLNLIWGIQRQMTLEWDKDITKRILIIVLSARIALQVEEAEASVIYTNLGV